MATVEDYKADKRVAKPEKDTAKRSFSGKRLRGATYWGVAEK